MNQSNCLVIETRDLAKTYKGPIEELLAGNQSLVYTLVLRGHIPAARDCVSSQPWVKSLQATSINGQEAWQVTVTDQAAAETQLLPLVLAQGLIVTEFGQKKVDLEEVFLGLTEGGHHGKH